MKRGMEPFLVLNRTISSKNVGKKRSIGAERDLLGTSHHGIILF